MATDTITRTVRPVDLADEIAELIAIDAEDRLFPLDAPPCTFADLHNHADANEYLIEAAEVLGFDMFSEGGDFPTMNAAIALVSERMEKPCDACGEALGPAEARITDEGTFHGIVCPSDAYRLR